MKVVMAEMVLKNANLTNEVYILRRLLNQYELATSQDLFLLMRWFMEQLKIPGAPGGQAPPQQGTSFMSHLMS